MVYREDRKNGLPEREPNENKIYSDRSFSGLESGDMQRML
jgi:hypothetical protein